MTFSRISNRLNKFFSSYAINYLSPMRSTKEFKEGIPPFRTIAKVTFGIVSAAEIVTSSVFNSLTQNTQGDVVVLPSKERLAQSTIPQAHFEECGKVSIQAAKDFGIKKPIAVIFEHEKISQESQPECVIATCSFSNIRGRSVGIVITPAVLETITPQEMYALAAHEAAHAKEEHVLLLNAAMYPIYAFSKLLLKTTLPGIFFRAPILSSFMLAYCLNKCIQYEAEKRADLVSANKLGTVEDLITALIKIEDYSFKDCSPEVRKIILQIFTMLSPIIDEHPPTATRIEYLKQLQNITNYPTQSRFFQMSTQQPVITMIHKPDEMEQKGQVSTSNKYNTPPSP